MSLMLRAAQALPRHVRLGLLQSRAAPLLRQLLNWNWPTRARLRTVRLAEPLAGHQMMLDWRTQKAYVFGVYETHVVDALRTLVQPGWTVVDAGAHVGYFTLLLARLVGPSGRVFAFEPLLDNCRALRHNVKMNGYHTVWIENKAVADRQDTVRIGSSDGDPLTRQAALRDSGEFEVESVALDSYFAPSDEVSLVKIDVEGSEASVLRGMRRILVERGPAIVMEVHGRKGAEVQVLEDLGYEVRALDPSGLGSHLLALRT